ncbi:hypothetical protein [Streptomyces sp. 900116325]
MAALSPPRPADQLAVTWTAKQLYGSSEQAGQPFGGALRRAHIQLEGIKGQMQGEVEERAAALFGCGERREPAGELGVRREGQP